MILNQKIHIKKLIYFFKNQNINLIFKFKNKALVNINIKKIIFYFPREKFKFV